MVLLNYLSFTWVSDFGNVNHLKDSSPKALIEVAIVKCMEQPILLWMKIALYTIQHAFNDSVWFLIHLTSKY